MPYHTPSRLNHYNAFFDSEQGVMFLWNKHEKREVKVAGEGDDPFSIIMSMLQYNITIVNLYHF